MKNIETPDKMHLGRLITELGAGKYVIPDFQREFEWEPWDVLELIKSIFEDYYIGTLLLWKANKENQKLLGCENIYGFHTKEVKGEHIILDGQQRLTALYYALFAPPVNYPRRKSRFYYVANIEPLLSGNLEEAFDYYVQSKAYDELLVNHEQLVKQKIFPLSLLKDYQFNSPLSRYLDTYREVWGIEEATRLSSLITEMLNQYELSYIELDREIPVEKVCDIFTRINRYGVKLDIFDLLNAMLRPKEIKLKEMWRSIEDEFDFKADGKLKIYILQTMSILLQGYCSPKYLYYLVPEAVKPLKEDKSEVLIKTPEQFIELWNSAVGLVKKTMTQLQNPLEFGVTREEFQPYPTMVPILSAINGIRKDLENNKIAIDKKIKQWYWATVLTQNYSSSVETKMTKDFNDLQSWFNNDSEVPSIVLQARDLIDSLDLESEERSGSAIYKAILNLLFTKGAKDWQNYDLLSYSDLDDHHIVVQDWGKKNGIGKRINTILNRTLISANTNRAVINNKMPNIYIAEMFAHSNDKESVYKVLESHLISRYAVEVLLRPSFTPEDFTDFINERKKTIKDELRSIFDDIVPNVGLINPNTPFTNKLLLGQIIANCSGYIHWIDKYFSVTGFEMILEAVKKPNCSVKEIQILTSIDKVEESIRDNLKDLIKELSALDIKLEMRAITDNTKSKIHDRWLISSNKIYNVPSTDTVQRGQYSEIKETTVKPPFTDWWDASLDLINDWNKIKEIIQSKSN